MNTPVREGETIDGSRTMRKKKERKQTTQGRDGRTVHRHHTGILRRGECGASRHQPLRVCLFLSLFAVCRRFSLQPSCHPAVFLLSSFSLPSILLCTVSNGLAQGCVRLSMENGRVLAPFLYAWVSEDECAPDLRGHHSRLRSTAIPPALECRSATRFTPRLRAASRLGDDARPPPTPP